MRQLIGEVIMVMLAISPSVYLFSTIIKEVIEEKDWKFLVGVIVFVILAVIAWLMIVLHYKEMEI